MYHVHATYQNVDSILHVCSTDLIQNVLQLHAVLYNYTREGPQVISSVHM